MLRIWATAKETERNYRKKPDIFGAFVDFPGWIPLIRIWGKYDFLDVVPPEDQVVIKGVKVLIWLPPGNVSHIKYGINGPVEIVDLPIVKFHP